MSRVVERWADGRPKTIKSDAKGTIYPEIGKGSLRRKESRDQEALVRERLGEIFGNGTNKAVADDATRAELLALKNSFL